MRERPILFSGPMVRAILDGRKTQTRRAVKLRNVNGAIHSAQWRFSHLGWDFHHDRAQGIYTNTITGCPYGVPGDRLWVRETWASVTERDDLPARPMYEADPVLGACKVLYRASDDDGLTEQGFRWRPSIHMPRWASRLTLTITDVRVERVQEISDSDVAAEGFPLSGADRASLKCSPPPIAPRNQFVSLWHTLNAKRGYGWTVNPWVWALTFTAEATDG